MEGFEGQRGHKALCFQQLWGSGFCGDQPAVAGFRVSENLQAHDLEPRNIKVYKDAAKDERVRSK